MRSFLPRLPASQRAARPHSFRPNLLGLEDRCTPATFTVNDIGDASAANPASSPLTAGGVVTLRSALDAANARAGADDIVFDATAFATAKTITLSGTELILSDATGKTTITGPAAGVTVNGNKDSRVFLIQSGASGDLSRLTITGGSSGSGFGGGVSNQGTLALTNCTVSGNAAPSGGGIYNVGDATLTNCTVSGNFAFQGGGLDNNGTATLINCTVSGHDLGGGGAGSGIYNREVIELVDCTLTGNIDARGGGGLFNDGTATLTNCNVSGNSAGGGGGGGVLNFAGTVTLTNCTVTGNDSDYGGGVLSNGTVNLINCTVSGNTASITSGTGAGILNYGTANLTNTIVAANTAKNAADIGGSVTGSNNLIGDAASAGGLTDGVDGNIVGVSGADLGLSALGFFGGPTQTMALLATSKAINAGTASGAPTTDQRGVPRIGGVDIGAFEFVPTNRLVDNLGDTDDGDYTAGNLTLREAINLSNANPGADTITFDPTVFGTPQTITLSGTELALADTTGTTTITGPAAGVTVDANGFSRVFLIAAGASGDFSGLTLTGGSTSGFGGGVSNYGTLALTNCTVSGNTTSSDGGGVSNYGTLALTNCTVSGNTAPSNGGGGVLNRGTATLTDCTMSGNLANFGGGGILNFGTATLTNCSVSGNTAGTGGGVNNFTGTANLTNCTVSGNIATNGGGVYTFGTTTLKNTIVAGNSATVNDSDIRLRGGTLSGANNLIGTGGSGGLVDGVDGNLVGVANPGLSALGNFGGPVQTFALLPGSPAINAGTSSGAPTTDARSKGRVGGVDIGAFESQGFTLTITGGNNQSAAPGSAFANPLAVSVTANDPGVPVDGLSVTFTAPGSGASATIAGSPATVAGGTASVTATANGTAGSFQVSASAVGATAVTFDLRNGSAGSKANQNTQPTYAVGAGPGGPGAVTVYNPDGSVNRTVSPFPDGNGARAVTADVNGDGVADTVVTTGPGVRVQVAVVDGKTGTVTTFDAFEDTFTGGAFVAAGDLDGDGTAEIAVSADTTGSARVSVFTNTGTVLADFFGIDDPNFRGGSRVAFGDVNNDGTPDLIVAAGTGGGPRIAVYDGKTVAGTFAGQPQRVIADFFAFEESLRNGAYVTAGDVNGDGFADLIFGGGPDGAPRVRIADGKGLLTAGDFGSLDAPAVAGLTIGNFFAGGSAFEAFREGVVVAAKDLDGDEFADLVAGVPTDSGSTVFTYPGKSLLGTATPPAATAFDVFPDVLTGVFVG